MSEWRVVECERTEDRRKLGVFNVVKPFPWDGKTTYSDGRPALTWKHHGAGGYTREQAEALVEHLNAPEQAEDLTDMTPDLLEVYSKAFQEAHRGPARFGLSLEVGTRRGGSALMFLMLLEQLYEGLEKPYLFSVDPYGFKPYVSGKPGVEDIPIYGDPDYLAMKALLAKYPNHAHFKMTSLDFFDRMSGCSFWFPSPKPFVATHQPGEFALGEEKRMGNLAFCLLDGDHSAKTIRRELEWLWFSWAQGSVWMNPAGIVCVDNVECDPKTRPMIEADFKADFGQVGENQYAIVRGLK